MQKKETKRDGIVENGPPDTSNMSLFFIDGNRWHSAKNTSKLCAEGAVVNMLHHMRVPDLAVKIQKLALLDSNSLVLELQLENLPKRIARTNDRESINKRLWLLQHFGFRRTPPVSSQTISECICNG